MDVRFFWLRRDRHLLNSYQTGVSLHGHTLCSEEPLDFLPRLAATVPAVGYVTQACSRHHQRIHGRPFEISRAWWTPPLSSPEAIRLERTQIEQSGPWRALVSLSDHDTIAPVVPVSEDAEPGPLVSIEWTVPFGPSFLHVGVHNLGPDYAARVQAMREFTAEPDPDRLPDLLEWLSADPGCLIALNHPGWDEKGIGDSAHWELVSAFLRRHGRVLHALELNGLRQWGENLAVLKLAEACGLPVVSGGDRHCCEPSALLNVTNAKTFAEFVDEVRCGKRSHVLIMPQYGKPQVRRFFELVCDVLREYPEHSRGQRFWTDRIFYRCEDGSTRSLTELWEGQPPLALRLFLPCFDTFRSQASFALGLGLGKTEKFTIPTI